MAPGCAISTPKSMLMPTAMKNSPSSRPLNGSMSVSSSRRYSLSASSTPARKAPSAIDRPSHCISIAMPTTSSSAAAVKTSDVLLRAIQRSAGRSNRRPPRMTPPTIPMTLIASQDRLTLGRAGFEPETPSTRPPSSGSSARIGIAATSWNKRIEKPACPLDVAQQVALLHHLKRNRRGRQRQPERRHHGGRPGDAQRDRHARQRRGAAQHLRAAPAEDRPAQAPQAPRLQLQPDQEQHQHHTELGKVQDVVDIAHQRRPQGPIAMPAAR
jgi:hypothetical protein